MQITKIPITDIVLDERNPRIAHIFEGVRGAANSQEWMSMALGQAAPEDAEGGTSASTYSSLKASIRAQRGLINPIIVTPNAAGKFVVIEGNTRVAIFRELAEEDESEDWKLIDGVIHHDLQEEGEHAIRLQAHMVGPRPWRPFAKAKYLHDLYANQKLSVTQILDFCGGSARRKEIEQYIAAFTDMTQHYMPIAQAAGAPPDYARFSSFVELQNIKPALSRAGHSVQEFAQWVYEGRLAPQQMVRVLPRILANSEARRQFFLHNAREAVKVLDQPAPNAVIGTASLDQLATALAVKIRQLGWPEVQAMKQDASQPTVQSILSCLDELKSLGEILGTTVDA